MRWGAADKAGSRRGDVLYDLHPAQYREEHASTIERIARDFAAERCASDHHSVNGCFFAEPVDSNDKRLEDTMQVAASRWAVRHSGFVPSTGMLMRHFVAGSLRLARSRSWSIHIGRTRDFTG